MLSTSTFSPRPYLSRSGYVTLHHHFGDAIFTEAAWEAKQRAVEARGLPIVLNGEGAGRCWPRCPATTEVRH